MYRSHLSRTPSSARTVSRTGVHSTRGGPMAPGRAMRVPLRTCGEAARPGVQQSRTRNGPHGGEPLLWLRRPYRPRGKETPEQVAPEHRKAIDETRQTTGAQERRHFAVDQHL